MGKVTYPQRVELQDLDPRMHAELLESWLTSPHVTRCWGEQSERLQAFLGRPADTHALIVADGSPVGYLCWSQPDGAEVIAAGLTDLPSGLVDIDILIGDHDSLGRGIGPRALRLLLDRIECRADFHWAGLGTSRSNLAAISAFEKAGFRVFRDFEDPDSGPCRYLVVELGGTA